MQIDGKKISIIGAVRSGIGAAKLAKRSGGIPFVSDAADRSALAENLETLQAAGIEFETGGHSERVYDCDFMIVSPGVPSDALVVKEAGAENIEIMSELEFASRFCKGTIVGITGTNGKTTTTTALDFVLNKAGKKSYSAGNIGLAFSEIADKVKEDEIVSLEISSFQLDFISSFKPKYSVILNITPDHLDRYENSLQKYIDSKMKITSNQNENDYFIYWNEDKFIAENKINSTVKEFPFSFENKLTNGVFVADNAIVFSNNGEEETVCKTSDIRLKGKHNLMNSLAVTAVAKFLGLSGEEIKNGLSEFAGVEHRLEFVRELNGVIFINDSKATNVDSVRYALQSYDNPLVLILGGKDKGNDYAQIKELVRKRVKKIIAIGSSANKIAEFFEGVAPVEIKVKMEDAVAGGYQTSDKGDVVLLSPACASFDMFDNYEHRGKVFKKIVMELQ
ncbi:MAG: UDP-N-acetylmuramoyl-L-alanine--D-glutamate ligase [Chlorobi bacterium]|nr:UDP-N-acetylmuramoyl-L-alanine--D-glutamate ligase [Chlorobiota bacterium]